MGSLRANSELATNKGKPLTQFHQKITQAGDKSVFELTFTKIDALGQIEEFENIGIFEKIQWVGLRGDRQTNFRRLEEALVATGLDGSC